MLRTYTLNSTRATGVKGGSLGGGSPGTWGSGYQSTTSNVGFAGRSNDYYCTNMTFNVSAYTNKNIVKVELWLTISIPRDRNMPIAKMRYSSGWYGDGSIIAYVPANGSGVQKINVGTSLPTYGYVIGPYQEEIGASYSYISISNAQLVITVNEEEERTYTFNLTPYGAKTNWGYLSNFNFNQSNSSNWVGYEQGWPDTTVFQNYGTGLAGDIRVGGTIQSISLTVNYSSQDDKGIAICKKTGAGINNYGYQSLGVEKVARQGSTSFTIDLTDKGICQYGYFLYQPDYNTYSYRVYTINSAVLTVVTLETPDLSVLIYDNNGGDGGPGTIIEETTTSSYTFTISSIVPTKLGNQFLGWALTSSASAPTLQPGDTITVNAGDIVTIYAVWKILNTIRIVNNNNLDIYLVYIVENNNLVPYQVNIVDENGNLVICT